MKVKNFAYRDEFIPQGSIAALQAEYGVNCQEIQDYIEEILR
jgi:deoxyxylulose-5-phosphate synthase